MTTIECDKLCGGVFEVMNLIDHEFTGAEVRALNAHLRPLELLAKLRRLPQFGLVVGALRADRGGCVFGADNGGGQALLGEWAEAYDVLIELLTGQPADFDARPDEDDADDDGAEATVRRDVAALLQGG